MQESTAQASTQFSASGHLKEVVTQVLQQQQSKKVLITTSDHYTLRQVHGLVIRMGG